MAALPGPVGGGVTTPIPPRLGMGRNEKIVLFFVVLLIIGAIGAAIYVRQTGKVKPLDSSSN